MILGGSIAVRVVGRGWSSDLAEFGDNEFDGIMLEL